MIENVFVVRQPIMDKEKKLWAYKLIFRESMIVGQASDGEADQGKTMIKVLSTEPFGTFSGGKKSFVTMESHIVDNQCTNFFPVEQTVFEFDAAQLDEAMAGRCRQLKEAGYELALSNVAFPKIDAGWQGLFDYIKIDTLMHDDDELKKMGMLYPKLRFKTIAERVNTMDDFRACTAFGFDYFQGTFVFEPVILKGKTLNPAKAAIMQLIGHLEKKDDVEIIESIFKRHVDLSYKLLALINSAAYALRENIASIRQAVMLLGYSQLKKWASVLLYTADSHDTDTNPLFEQAAIRAQRMEMIAQSVPYFHDTKDDAYFTGMISCFESFLEMPIEEIVASMRLEDRLKHALIERSGKLGELISMAELIEQEAFVELVLAAEHAATTPKTILDIATQAIVVFEQGRKKEEEEAGLQGGERSLP